MHFPANLDLISAMDIATLKNAAASTAYNPAGFSCISYEIYYLLKRSFVLRDFLDSPLSWHLLDTQSSTLDSPSPCFSHLNNTIPPKINSFQFPFLTFPTSVSLVRDLHSWSSPTKSRAPHRHWHPPADIEWWTYRRSSSAPIPTATTKCEYLKNRNV